MTPTTSTLSDSAFSQARKAAQLFRAYNHKLRQQMLKTIDAKGESSVTDLYNKLRLEQSVCSQHLAILRGVGLVTTRREGKQIYYSVAHKRITDMLSACNILNA